MKFKPGDIAICVDDTKKSLTFGKKYKVLRTFTQFIIIINDENDEVDYYQWRFKNIKQERIDKLKKLNGNSLYRYDSNL